MYIHKAFGFRPYNIAIYELAMVHKSMAKSDKFGCSLSNERLEFLGDAILGSVVAEYLYVRFPNKDEGFLTQLRSRVVNRQSLTDLAIKIGLDQFISFKSLQITKKSHIYGDALEAIVGAIYMDQGYSKTKKIIIDRIIKPFVDIDQIEFNDTNYKSQVIEWGQKNRKEVVFTTKDSSSSSEDSKFRTLISIDGVEVGNGVGFSKKQSQQNAAQGAIAKMKI